MNSSNKKSLPNPRQYDLIPPDMDHVYFENFEAFPLEPGNTEYSPANAWWFGEFSFLAYCHPGFIRMACLIAGFEGFHFLKGKGTECLICWNDSVAIVSFRGTELKSMSAMHEIRTDMNTIPVPFELGGKVHKGFLEGLEEIWNGPQGLETFLDEITTATPSRPLWITGHSLGGALATLCFARTPQAKGLYVYGAPRVGDQDFVDTIHGRPIWRMEHGRDPVPMVPPDLPAMKFNFKDPGRLVFITKDGQIQSERPTFTIGDQKEKFWKVRDIQNSRKQDINQSLFITPFEPNASKVIFGKIGEHLRLSRNEWQDHWDELNDSVGLKVDDHQPIFYVIKLWNALLVAK